jgi:hypothetical protein
VIVAQLPVSRPLRAFFVVVGGWTAMRVALLWQVTAGVAAPLVEAGNWVDGVRLLTMADLPVGNHPQVARHVLNAARVAPGLTTLSQSKGRQAEPVLGSTLANVSLAKSPANRSAPQTVPTGLWLPPSTKVTRFSGSGWVLLRPDSAGAALGTGGTLGASQAGVRVFYEPGRRGLALTARISAPLAVRLGREASVGVGIRGKFAGILVERRIALDGGARNAMSVTAYGGVSNVALPFDLKLDGYAQAGVVGARSRDAFADGAVRVVHALTEVQGLKFSAGGSMSGGAQPGVARLDVGPELVADLTVGTKSIRVAAGWRERVAGRAAPGSGPSVSIGFGF